MRIHEFSSVTMRKGKRFGILSGKIFAAAVSLAVLAGCSKELPQKNESPGKAAAPKAASNQQAPAPSGEALFKQFCFSCHPDGNNVTDPARTLHGSALQKNHITKPEDIVRIMRRPISRMIRFDAETISDRDARIIAEYVLKTYK